uniref:SH3 domain-containing protein n=1 Tax=Knipowitschia caucasica TaxID=637954 RepID=A0AAV2LKD1_KNICA
MMSKGNRTSGTAGDIRITDPSNKNGSDHIKLSPGPLSSIKAAIKRSKPSSQSDHRKGYCRRRPEITVVSAEPLDSRSWSPGSPLVSSALHTPPQQVPTERTQEAHIKPVAPPRHLNGTATTTTTTTPKSSGLKPPKPPRPSARKNKKTPTVTDDHTNVHRSKPPKLTRENSVHDEGFAKEPPTPMVKPVKEPLKPNLNINNHNNYSTQPVYEDAEDAEDAADDTEDPTYSEYEYVERPSEGFGNAYEFPALDEDNTSQGSDTTESQYEYVEYHTDQTPEKVPPKTYEEKPSNILPVKLRSTMNNYVSRQSLDRRPTTIIVPSKSASFSDGFQDNPPPLPVQKSVGARKAPPVNRHSIASFPTQVSHSPTPEPSLPPRRLTTSKTLPPRPPSVKSGPGRPPAPCMEAAGRSHTVPWDSQPQATQKRGPVLPPRPNPGHKLYSKYTLQVPHAVAANDYNGSSSGELSFQKNEVLVLLNTIDPNTYECQVGDRRGRVHRSSLKVITPLTTASDDSATQGGKQTTLGNGLTVKVLHDFNPENPGELGLKAGDVVTMVEQVDSEWYRGTCRGSSGFFPINYVQVQYSLSESHLGANSPRPPDRTAKPAATVSGPRCVARFDFEGEHSDELSFSEGDTIQLKAFVGQDWARGELGSVTGIFPLNFVEIIQDLPPGHSQQPTKPTKFALPGMSKSSLTPETSQAQSGSEWSVALYDFSGNSDSDLSFEKGDRILVTKHIDEEWSSGRLNGQEGIFPRAFVSNTAGKTSSHQNRSAGGVSAKALYDYESDCDEELSLKVGDRVTNIEIVDDEWFLGDLGGKRALVPKNYVEVL